ncbi:Asp23/Gls24 family envelope stress response protein [Micromonospora sp. BRA006-A]|nr:Asp23/Gls24 family envelope stress response protein [Micromonospora sp. BRA006-A]
MVEKIAVAAAESVPGVAELGGDIARFFNAVLDRVGLEQVGDARRGCSAHVSDGSAVVNLVLVIDAGYPVPQVTGEVRARWRPRSRRTAASRRDQHQGRRRGDGYAHRSTSAARLSRVPGGSAPPHRPAATPRRPPGRGSRAPVRPRPAACSGARRR